MSKTNVTFKIALPYAEALLNSAQADDLVERTNQDLSYIQTVLSESYELQLFLKNPLIVSSIKKNVLENLFANHVNKKVLKFLQILIERRRISILNSIIVRYFQLSYQLESTIVAEIATAIMFTEIQQQSLINVLKKITGSRQVNLSMQLDSSLIAGFTIKIGSKIIDTSLSGRLKQMALHLSGI